MTKKFALLDLIALLAVLFLLGQIVPIAIVRARSASRSNSCRVNLRNLVRGLQEFESTANTLPAAAHWSTEGMSIEGIYNPSNGMEWWPNITSVPPGSYHDTNYQNWAIELLPFIGHSSASFDGDSLISSDANAEIRLMRPDTFNCPSDEYNTSDSVFNRELGSVSSSYSRGNYAINGGSQRDCQIPGSSADPCVDGFHYRFDENTNTFEWWGNGIAGINKSLRSSEFASGTSKVVAVEEIRAGVHELDPRGTWALGQIGSSITFSHGISGDATGPNANHENADDIAGCARLVQAVSHAYLVEQNMGCCPHCKGSVQATSRSMHQNGVNVAMMDGSVRFVRNEISPQVWHVMHSRDVGELDLREDDDTPTSQREKIAINRGEPNGESTKYIDNSVGMRFRRVPAGEFMMGLPDKDARTPPPEIGVHKVKIGSDYYIGETEVTQAQFVSVMKSHGSFHASDSGKLPVESVTWNDAVEFCKRIGDLPEEKSAGRSYRLPTEAEWEYACRGSKSDPYEYSQERDQNDNSGDNGGHMREPLQITEVASYPPNALGLYDMRGNVWEWTADNYARDYYGRSPELDPQGPDAGLFKVPRGSDWVFAGDNCLLHRFPIVPTSKHKYIGFRVICELD